MEINSIQASGVAPLEPTTCRYIKLGPGGAWFDRCLAEGLVELGHAAAPHDVAVAGDWAVAKQAYLDQGHSAGKASDFVRELRDFYTLPASALWITIGRGRLWWTFADRTVEPVSGPGRGSRIRRTVRGWRSTDLLGAPLELAGLSTRLTKVAAYRQTLCSIEAEDYLIRRINGVEEPDVARAFAAHQALTGTVDALIKRLDWRDFELLIDLIFAASGWRRISAVGGATQSDSDLILRQAATGERAFVQVKSRASQAVLDDYIERFGASGCQHLFFACHSPTGPLEAPQDPRIHVWLGARLAAQAVEAGLTPWLIEKSR